MKKEFVIDFGELEKDEEFEEVLINAKIPVEDMERFKKNINKLKAHCGYKKLTQKKLINLMIKQFNEYVEELD